MPSYFWQIFGIATALKALLIPAKYSTDFEVHRNWLAITHSLPLSRWYADNSTKWPLDYPPFFAYFEWTLSQIAKYVDPLMLNIEHVNYSSEKTIFFQRFSVIAVDIIYAFGVKRCVQVLNISKNAHQHFTAELLLLLNVGLIFIDHIHFQYNGMLYGVLLLSISYLLERKFLKGALLYAILLNFKHIFLYMAPAFAVFVLKCYIMKPTKMKNCNMKYYIRPLCKIITISLIPFLISFGPFWSQLIVVIKSLFPFKRGLTHAYWAPNAWALYNTGDKIAAFALGRKSGASTASGLVQNYEYSVLPNITPIITFILTLSFMLPILVKFIFFTNKSEEKLMFLRTLILCGWSSFVFGWHVHEKAILMCIIPFCLLALLNHTDAKYAFLLSFVGHFSLFPLLFYSELIIVRYSLYGAYILGMYAQLTRIFKASLMITLLERVYMCGFIILPLYEHIFSPLLGLNIKLPFMPLLLISFYTGLGTCYLFITYYCHVLGLSKETFKNLFARKTTEYIVSTRINIKRKKD